MIARATFSPRLARIMQAGLVWFTPPAHSPIARARAAHGAVRLTDETLRALLRAGAVEGPWCGIAADLLDLRKRIEAEADAIAAAAKFNPDED